MFNQRWNARCTELDNPTRPLPALFLAVLLLNLPDRIIWNTVRRTRPLSTTRSFTRWLRQESNLQSPKTPEAQCSRPSRFSNLHTQPVQYSSTNISCSLLKTNHEEISEDLSRQQATWIRRLGRRTEPCRPFEAAEGFFEVEHLFIEEDRLTKEWIALDKRNNPEKELELVGKLEAIMEKILEPGVRMYHMNDDIGFECIDLTIADGRVCWR